MAARDSTGLIRSFVADDSMCAILISFLPMIFEMINFNGHSGFDMHFLTTILNLASEVAPATVGSAGQDGATPGKEMRTEAASTNILNYMKMTIRCESCSLVILSIVFSSYFPRTVSDIHASNLIMLDYTRTS